MSIWGKDLLVGRFKKTERSIRKHFLNPALTKVLRLKLRLMGLLRTDTGVNALGQCAHFLCNNKIQNKFKFLSSVNYFLNKFPISVLNLEPANSNFHARHSAKKRLYEYVIFNKASKLSVDRGRVWLVSKPFDFNRMKKAISYFKGT